MRFHLVRWPVTARAWRRWLKRRCSSALWRSHSSFRQVERKVEARSGGLTRLQSFVAACFEVSQARFGFFERLGEAEGIAHDIIQKVAAVAVSLDAIHTTAQLFAKVDDVLMHSLDIGD